MGFERDEVPSRVQGSALPGQGQRPCVPRAKPENPRAIFAKGERAQPTSTIMPAPQLTLHALLAMA